MDYGFVEFMVRRRYTETKVGSWYPLQYRCKCPAGYEFEKHKDNRGEDHILGGAKLQMSKDVEVYQYDGVPVSFSQDQTIVMDLSLNNIRIRDPLYKERGRMSIVQSCERYVDSDWLDYLEWRDSDERGVTDEVAPF
jgi:hypothetical protein